MTQQQNQELGVQLGTLSHSESELLEANQRLRETLERLREDVRGARAQAERSQQEAERCGCCLTLSSMFTLDRGLPTYRNAM